MSGRKHAKSQAEVLQVLLDGIPGAQAKGWRDAVLDAFSDPDDDDEDDSLSMSIAWMRLIPDAFLIDEEAQEVHFFEVEITNLMSNEKLQAYARLLSALFAFNVSLLVFTVNQYGHINQVDLTPFCVDWLIGIKECIHE